MQSKMLLKSKQFSNLLCVNKEIQYLPMPSYYIIFQTFLIVYASFPSNSITHGNSLNNTAYIVRLILKIEQECSSFEKTEKAAQMSRPQLPFFIIIRQD